MDILGLFQGYCKCVLRCLKGVPRVLHGSPKDVFNGVYWVFHGHFKSFSTVAHGCTRGIDILKSQLEIKLFGHWFIVLSQHKVKRQNRPSLMPILLVFFLSIFQIFRGEVPSMNGNGQ